MNSQIIDPNIMDILNSESFQHMYIQTVLNFSDQNGWDLDISSQWTSTSCLRSPPINIAGGIVYVEIETYIKNDFSFVDMTQNGWGLPGKIFAHTRIDPVASQIDYFELTDWRMDRKLASLKLGKIASRSQSDPLFFKAHFSNFCNNAVLELQSRIMQTHI